MLRRSTPCRRSLALPAARLLLVSFLWLGSTGFALAQTPPEISFVYPPAVPAGQTTSVTLGGYNWTTDVQLFCRQSGVTLELAGAPGPVLVPEPPYWFGKKARDNDLPLPRQFPAKITVAPGTPPGFVRWQAANANGATATGLLLVVAQPDVLEQRVGSQTQILPSLPCTVAGYVRKLEEVDRYEFTAGKSGPVTLDLWTRRLGSKMNAIVEVRDAAGTLVADAADTTGHDLQITFAAREAQHYVASVYDVDFRGHHSFVYRLHLHNGPRVVAALPASGKRGETRPVEFRGYGLATGQPVLESVTQSVTFPTDAAITTFDYTLATPFGTALPFALTVSDRDELAESAAAGMLSVPAAVTGVLETRFGEDRFTFVGKKGDTWAVNCRSTVRGIPLDPVVTILDGTGKELVRGDDLPGMTDASLTFAVPADGTYVVSVSDVSGMSGSPSAVYRLTIEPQTADFTLTVPEMLSLPLGGKAPLPVKVSRLGGLAEPIALKVNGLPEGATVPADLVIPMGKSDLNVEITVAADTAVTARPITVEAQCQALAKTGQTLAAITMKPRVKLTPEGLDDVRKWPRGSTYPAPVLIERLEGYAGDIVLEQTAHQQRVRQGLTGPDFPVPAGASRVEYPVFIPEWMETTKTSRIILNSVVAVPDPKGTVRQLLQKMELRIGMLPVGAMLKVSHGMTDDLLMPGMPFEVPVTLTRSPELTGQVTLELHLPDELKEQFAAEKSVLPAGQAQTKLKITPAATVRGEHDLTIRATTLYQDKWLVVSETTFTAVFAGGN